MTVFVFVFIILSAILATGTLAYVGVQIYRERKLQSVLPTRK